LCFISPPPPSALPRSCVSERVRSSSRRRHRDHRWIYGGQASPGPGVLAHLTPGDRSSRTSRAVNEVEELRASRRRLVLAGDAWSRELERELHDGLQQQLVALSVDLQHASALVEHDPAELKSALDGLARDVQMLLDEAGRLAERIHTPLLEVRGRLAAA